MGRREMDERSAFGKEIVGRKPLPLSRTIHIKLSTNLTRLQSYFTLE
jgi:hypothetical protein